MAATKGKKKGLGRWIQEHLMQVLVLLLAVALGFLAVRIQMYQASAEEMQTQISQKDEQLERQGLLINEWKGKNETENTSESIPVVTSSTIKTQLSSLQELVTQEYVYTNADKRESTEKWIFGWERPFSGKSILITYDGTIKAGIDLKDVTVEVDEENKKITVTLPESKITDNNIPQESISIVEVKNGLFNDVTFDNYNEFISEQKIIMEQKAIDRGILTKADQEARTLVESSLNLLPGIDAYKVEIK